MTVTQERDRDPHIDLIRTDPDLPPVAIVDRSPMTVGKRIMFAIIAIIGACAWAIIAFVRGETVANDELFPDHDDPRHDRRYRVGRVEAGYAWRTQLAGPVGLALGGTVATYALPAALESAYGDAPVSWTAFAKLAVGL